MKQILTILWTVERWIAGTFLVLMVALIFLGGVARLMHYPLNWTIDISTCLFAWACFFCANIAWRNNNLMSIELVTERLSPAWAKVCSYLSYMFITGFLIYLIIAGVWLSWISRTRSFQGIPEVSYSWVTMSLPVGAALLLITTALKIRDELRAGAPRTADASLRDA